MKILGINAGRAAPPKFDPHRTRPLADGSAALLVDGRIACAAVEERHSRVRYDGGFKKSVPAILGSTGINLGDLDAIGLSTCCDSPWSSEVDRIDAVIEELRDTIPEEKIRDACAGRIFTVNHHDSHAALAFSGSGFKKALVCVVDGFGNRLDDTGQFHLDPEWWHGQFERQTVYLAEWRDGRFSLKRVYEGAAGREEIGLAELYRSVTHFLGWPSYQFAGKTMALAGYGDPHRFKNLSLVKADCRRGLRITLPNHHSDPVAQISQFISGAGYAIPDGLLRPARPGEPFFADLAALLQNQFEESLIGMTAHLADKHGVDKVCFSGGAALNCIALGKLARQRPDLQLYVPPAPGDTGQGLGNALWLAYAEESPLREDVPLTGIKSAMFGPRYTATSTKALAADFVSRNPAFRAEYLAPAELARRVAQRVASGQIVGVRIGPAEYGPRALGNCSIIADLRDPSANEKVNHIKKREPFRPFSASILAERTSEYFGGLPDSPFMSFAAVGSSAFRELAPGVVHIDGTTRFQNVYRDLSHFHAIISEFESLTGVPAVLNTSFNLSGEPMVETPSDTIDVFARSDLDAVALDGVVIARA